MRTSLLAEKLREKIAINISGCFCSNHYRLPDLSLTTSRKVTDRKVGKFEKNITKHWIVPEASTKKGNNSPVGPVLLGFFVFFVIGSSLFQIIRTATSGGMA
ncbi:hypothetical protein Fot_14545 [Forsythia ovata]|uniref:Stress-associated endoplasmic reticulum protein n=1 Tax=Forsythia ovata TaxID=205694 RepID=A0ABD1W6Y1_9LAMI